MLGSQHRHRSTDIHICPEGPPAPLLARVVMAYEVPVTDAFQAGGLGQQYKTRLGGSRLAQGARESLLRKKREKRAKGKKGTLSFAETVLTEAVWREGPWEPVDIVALWRTSCVGQVASQRTGRLCGEGDGLPQ